MNNDEIKHGVFLARMQPLHNAHLWVVNQMLKTCEEVTIMLGSENKREMLRNPFCISLRSQILEEALDNKEDMDRIEIYTLPDWSMESDVENAWEWGRFLYYNIVSRIESKSFTMFYSDDPNIMLGWFEDYLQAPDRVSFKFFERQSVFDGLSSTKIRQAFEEDDIDYIRKYCPESVVSRYNYLKQIWFQVKEDPKLDFAMK